MRPSFLLVYACLSLSFPRFTDQQQCALCCCLSDITRMWPFVTEGPAGHDTKSVTTRAKAGYHLSLR